MAQDSRMVRKSYFVDPKLIGEATKLTGAKSEAEALRKIIATYVQQQRFWRFMEKSAGKLKRGSFKL